MSWLTNLFKDVKGFFGSAKAQAVEKQIAALLPAAMVIVREINEIAPNKTLTQLNTVATKYALPTISYLAEGVTPGNVALNLGTQILQKNHAPEAATALLNTVVQLAVVAEQTSA